MRPVTAIKPTSSVPGATGRPVISSSTRTRSLTANRAGLISSPTVDALRVIIPSEAPSESNIVTRGRCWSSPVLISGLHVTPDDMIGPQPRESPAIGAARRAPRATGGRTRRRRYESSSTALRSTSSQTSAASSPGPVDRARPCRHRRASTATPRDRSRASTGSRAGRSPARLPACDRRDWVGRLRARAAHLPQRDVQVVVAPHHALGQAGGPSGVEEDQVVAVGFAFRPGAGGRRCRQIADSYGSPVSSSTVPAGLGEPATAATTSRRSSGPWTTAPASASSST